MPRDFNATRADNERHSHALIASNSRHSAVTRPDYLATLKCRVYAALYGFLEAGAVVEIVGDSVRLGGGWYVVNTFTLGGVEIPAVLLTTPYTPLLPEMVVSPVTGQLVPANSGTGRRALANGRK